MADNSQSNDQQSLESRTSSSRDVIETHPAESKVEARPRKAADRPHQLTLLASFGALAVSVCSMAISLMSSRTQQSSLAIAEANLRASQRPFLEVSWSLKKDLNRIEDGRSSAPKVLVFSITLKNVGNTTAKRVRCNGTNITLTDGNAGQALYDKKSCGVVDLDRTMRRMFDLPVEMTPQQWQLFRQKKKRLEITLALLYKDGFGQEFSVPFYVFFEGDGSSNVPLGF